MKELKDYLHYYLGQRCLNTWFPQGHEMRNAGWVLTGFDSGSFKPYKLSNDDDFTWTNEIQLILRRLSDMTEEEAIKLIELRSDALIDIQDVELTEGGSGIHYTHRYRIASRRFKKFFYIRDLNSNQFHYLLKQGYDLFNLIDEGLAVDLKTLKQ